MWAAALAVGMATVGCALVGVGAAVGAGAVGTAYAKGDMHVRVEADPRAVEKAALMTFETMGLRKLWSYASPTEAELAGKTADASEITIKAVAVPGGLSAMSIRVGTFGDEYMSQRVYDQIKAYLPEATRALEEELKAKPPEAQ